MFILGWGAALLAAAGMARASSEATQNASQAAPSQPATEAPGQETPASATPAPATSAFFTQNYLTGNWGGVRDEVKKYGISFAPVFTAEVFGNPSGGARQGAVTDGLVNLPLDIDLDPLSGGAIKDTVFHVNAFYIYGTNLSAQYVHNFSATSNIAAYNTLRLDELWLQKAFWDKKITVKVGNMAVDNEFFQSNSAALFINGTFGAFNFVADNIPDVPLYPLASPGVRVQVLPDPRFYIMAGVYGLDNNSFPNTNNQNGTRFSLDGHSGMLVMSEAGFLLNQQPDDKGLSGTYRVGSFVDTGNATTFESQGDFANGTGSLRSAGVNYGVYGVVDQQVYADGPRKVSIFTRVGGAPTNTNFVDYYVDAGCNCCGFVPGRDSDVAGVAVARSHVSQDYSVSQIAQGEPPSSAETVLEATYKVQLAPWWNVQPDLQYIITPDGVRGSTNALVLGLRTSVAF